MDWKVVKTCTKCGATKPVEAFPRDKTRKDGRHPWCKDHRPPPPDPVKKADYDRQRRQNKRWEKKASHYGVTVQFLKDLHAKQDGLCAICRKPEVNKHQTGCTMELAVDHDHKTNIVRGFLCQKCNQGLGMFQDDPELMLRAINYLVTGASV